MLLFKRHQFPSSSFLSLALALFKDLGKLLLPVRVGVGVGKRKAKRRILHSLNHLLAENTSSRLLLYVVYDKQQISSHLLLLFSWRRDFFSLPHKMRYLSPSYSAQSISSISSSYITELTIAPANKTLMQYLKWRNFTWTRRKIVLKIKIKIKISIRIKS